MDLVEAFGARTSLHHGGMDFTERVENGISGDVVIIDAPSARTGGSETTQLFIDTTIRQASRFVQSGLVHTCQRYKQHIDKGL